MATHISHNTLNGHGWILGLLVLLIGQGLNFVLCLMSAVIHSLRLNYIEFFKWSVKEEGYTYAPLKKTEASNE
jgi:V/A-type H+-transporting ATPase subunit I